jgi:hypothetical protein
MSSYKWRKLLNLDQSRNNEILTATHVLGDTHENTDTAIARLREAAPEMFGN